VLYQSPPPADTGNVNGLYSGFTEGRFRKKITKNSPLGPLSHFFHCLTGDTFGYNVIEPFGIVLFRTGDSVALPTLGSENTPLCRVTVKCCHSRQIRPILTYSLLYVVYYFSFTLFCASASVVKLPD